MKGPNFYRRFIVVDLSESQLSGPVVSVVATDDDVDDNAKLTYSIVTQNDLNFFSIITLPSNDGVITVYKPHDKDSPPNNEFTFSIADHADRFYVEQHGDYCMVKIQNGLDGQTLDRETSDQYTVKVLAIDKGIPAQTGTATLYIKVTDLNDEAPTFAKQYRPIVMEDEDPSHEPVITFSAMDRDTKNMVHHLSLNYLL
ncbi:unnamed protein product [Mytilus edulis]|uniref:Cadherin domain-containing protein n=1 Tax=Mytilus edulis TaxID=6550 RepID=A0A8S3SC05_MYTED|nr:unnamed protein product [Mytilus edulis]